MREGLLSFRSALVLAVAVVVTLLWLPPGGQAHMVVGANAVLPLVLWWGIRRHRPARAGVWWCIIGCTVLWGLSLLPLAPVQGRVLGPATGHDVLSLGGYAVLIVGILGAARRASSDRPAQFVVDATIFAMGCVSVIWSFAARPGLGTEVPLTTLSSPFLDGLALMAAARLVMIAGGAASPTLLLLALGAMTVGDLASLQAVRDQGSDGSHQAAMVCYVTSCLLAALAALHPSMVRFGNRGRPATPHLERLHLTAVAIAAVMPPLMLLRERDHPTISTAGPLLAMSGVVFTLVVLRLERMMGVVDGQRVQLESLARTDHLTSLPNRRTGEAEMRRMMREAIDQEASLVAVLLDLDHFKAYNDQHGHPAGDRLLESTASAWRRSLPTDVFLSRHGGEEFLLLAKGRHPDNVRLLLEGLRGAAQTGQTFSAGAAVWDGVESLVTLLLRADVALYDAKASGRDAVRFARHRPVVLGRVDA
ncbi:GGDEF domain-containing protein [Arsenicicoccus sp. oral taxon 190]|uniref:GGDEF domain-containing protein n=1 Tax=Arsenicicoccus sp. oral taxon 190 TaxID=1658671 RepID=UPI00067B03CE|nr:GGDEF domain-containing protein [Arsenicicoccus sp. oral taxon 190]